jgi:hypothetical protein
VWFWSNHFCVNAVTHVRLALVRRGISPTRSASRRPGAAAEVIRYAKIPTMRVRWAQPSPASTAPESMNFAAHPANSYARRAHCLHTGGRHQLCWQHRPDDLHAGPPTGGEFLFHPRMHEPAPRPCSKSLPRYYASKGVVCC